MHSEIKAIETEAFMVFVFTNVPDDVKQLTFRQLRRIKDNFQGKLWRAKRTFVEIGWTRDEVLHAISVFNRLFKLVDDSVVWLAEDNHAEREIFGIDFSRLQNEEIDNFLKEAIATVLESESNTSSK